ncbi:acyl-CoA dehydrogenase family protein, partial [Nocardioides dubius]
MDFSFTPEQDEAAALAASILKDRATNTRMRTVEEAGDRFDRELWAELGNAGLLGLHLPEAHGGAGLGLIELARVLAEIGRTVAPVPLATHGAAGAAIAALGTAAQQERWLPGAADGSSLLSVAISEERAHLPAPPTVTATPDGDAWVLDGVKTLVRAGMAADAVLVTAQTPSGAGVFVVSAEEAGVERATQHTSDGDALALVTLRGVRLDGDRLLGAADGISAARLVELATVTAAAEQYGVIAGAVRLTAQYAKEREQFGRPIATFQAVSQRLADGYIDNIFEGLTLWQAVWRLDAGLPAAVEVASA